jgi:hypothetical protein
MDLLFVAGILLEKSTRKFIITNSENFECFFKLIRKIRQSSSLKNYLDGTSWPRITDREFNALG